MQIAKTPYESHVKIYEANKGYGFIHMEGSHLAGVADMFFHASGFRIPRRNPNGTISWMPSALNEVQLVHGIAITVLSIGTSPKGLDMALEWTIPGQIMHEPLCIIFDESQEPVFAGNEQTCKIKLDTLDPSAIHTLKKYSLADMP